MNILQQLRTRRHFMYTSTMAAAGLVLTSCEAPQEQPSRRQNMPEETNLFRGLRQYVKDMERDDRAHSYGFLDKNGKAVDLAELEARLQGSYKTVSGSFAACTAICPYTNRNLGRLDRISGKKLVNVIISVQPGVDGITAASRENFEAVLRNEYKLPDGFIVLYPARDGVASAVAAEGIADPTNPLKERGIPKLSTRLGAPCDMNSPVRHSGDVLLYGPDGNYLAKENGMFNAAIFERAFAPYLDYKKELSR